MTCTDPTISLFTPGASTVRPDPTSMLWSRIVLEAPKDIVDYVLLYIHVGTRTDNHHNFQSAPKPMELHTELVEGLIDGATQDAERDEKLRSHVTYNDV